MAIYRYQKIADYTIPALKENTIRFSRLANLNDPYETWCRINTKLPKTKNHHALIKFLIKRGDIPNHSAGAAFINDMDRNRLDQFLRNLESENNKWLEQFRKEKTNNITLCCFSKKPDIFLMWGHYGDGLKGICIEYDDSILQIEGINASKLIYEVDYPETDDLPCVNFYDCYMNDDSTELFKAMFTTKYHHWDYEEEKRIIKEVRESRHEGHDISHNVQINKEAVKRIIFGKNASPLIINEIKSIFKDSDVAFSFAVRNTDKYKIEIIDL